MQQHPITSEIKNSLTLALPLVVSFLVQQLTPFFGVMMIAHLSEDALAAQALAMAIFRVLIVFFFSTFGAVNILVSHSFGAQDSQGVRQAVLGAFQLGAFLSLIVMIFTWIAPIGLYWSKQSQPTIVLSILYMRLMSLYVLPMSFLFVIERFLISIQRTRIVLLISLLQVPFEILALYCFIFGKLGLPKMGLIGSAYAYLVVYVSAVFVLSLFLMRSKTTRGYHLFSHFWKIQWKFVRELFRVGWPLGISSTLEVFLFATVTFMMGWLSETELAAYQIANQFMNLLLVCLFALVQTTIIRVGQAVGMNDKKSIQLTTLVNIGITFSFILLIAILIMAFSNVIIQLDIKADISDYHALIHYATIFLSVSMITLLVESVRFNIVGALRGMKDTRFPMFASFIGLWLVGIPSGYLLAFKWHLGGVGLLLGILIGICVAGIVLGIRFYRLLKYTNLAKLITWGTKTNAS